MWESRKERTSERNSAEEGAAGLNRLAPGPVPHSPGPTDELFCRGFEIVGTVLKHKQSNTNTDSKHKTQQCKHTGQTQVFEFASIGFVEESNVEKSKRESL